MIVLDELKNSLIESFKDERLDSNEKHELLATYKNLNTEQRSFVRNRAFDITQDACSNASTQDQVRRAITWLENIIKTLDSSEPELSECRAYFSPGDQCLEALISLINKTQKSLDVCVFTISENQLRDALIEAHHRQVRIRIISDDDKSLDRGSDIESLSEAGIQLRLDRTRHHMHHKFVISDSQVLATGSFNWTRSASLYNHENIIMLDDATSVSDFSGEFNSLWTSFSN